MALMVEITSSKMMVLINENMFFFCFQADLRRADIQAKQRAMEDSLMALEVKFLFFAC